MTSPHPQILIHGLLGLFNDISLQNILKWILLDLLSERDCILKVRTLHKHFLTRFGGRGK